MFVSKCARLGEVGVIDGDVVDDEGVDIAYRPGSNHWRGLVVCGLDRRKSTVEEAIDGEVLAWVDFKSLHGLAPGQGREKVGEEHVEVDKFYLVGDEWGVDEPRFISHKDFPCNKAASAHTFWTSEHK